MAKIDPFSVLYHKQVSALDFKWDTMVAPPLLSLISPQDIYALNKIATSNKLASDPDTKYKMIDNILVPRGFKKIASGTNRVAYKYLENQDLCLKVAIDRVGLKDNPAEFQNQFKLKPFVVRLFEISPCGTVALEERVEPLVHIEEYINIIDDVFNFIVEKIIGKYVVDDIGNKYWQNTGIRSGFGPVLLDFPYVYELDGAKLHCNWMNPDTHEYCFGEIDYDDGFNQLVCNRCGKKYFAKQLGKQVEKRAVVVERKGEIPAMSIKLMRGDKVVKEFNTEREASVITPPSSQQEKPLVNMRVLNKKKFEKRQLEKDKKNKEYAEAVKDANKRHDERMQKQVEEGLKVLHEGSQVENKEDNQRTVNLAELTENPSAYLQNSRFPKAAMEVNEKSERLVDISEQQDNSLTTNMGDLLKDAGVQFSQEYVSNDENTQGDTDLENDVTLHDIVEVPVTDYAFPEEDKDDENVRYLNGVKYTKVDTEEPTSEDIITEEMRKNSSWDNPVKCTEVTIDLEDDDSVMDMY